MSEYDSLRSEAVGLLAALADAVAEGEVEVSDDYLRGRVLTVGLRLGELMDKAGLS